MKTKRRVRAQLVRLAALVCVVLAAVFFFKTNKDLLKKECLSLLESILSRNTQKRVKIGRVSTRLNTGSVKFYDVVAEEAEGDGMRPVFLAKEIRIHYNLLELISKKQQTRPEIVLVGSRLYWRPSAGVKPQGPSHFSWMREWAMPRAQKVSLRFEGLDLVLPSGKTISGINGRIEANDMSLEVPFRHIEISGADVSSTVKLAGHYDAGAGGEEDRIVGTLRTEGTVINWNPLPQESSFDFEYGEHGLKVTSSDLLGGVHMSVEVDFDSHYDLRLYAEAKAYPLSNLDLFVKAARKTSMPGTADFVLDVYGSPWAPNFEASVRISDGRFGRSAFKGLDLHLAGVYPTAKLTQSRILNTDGTAMRLADRDLEIADLFDKKTFERLVKEEQQDEVVWGDWAFTRPESVNEEPDYLMQRGLGGHAFVNLRRSNEMETHLEKQDTTTPVGVGFEYRIKSKNSLKFEVKEDERFVGVERKMKF